MKCKQDEYKLISMKDMFWFVSTFTYLSGDEGAAKNGELKVLIASK